MYLPHRHRRRRGATLAESALILLVFLILTLGLLDVGSVVVRDNILSAAARQLSRQVIIHGQLAPAAKGSWTGPWSPTNGYPGKNPYCVHADKDDPIANAVRPYLAGLDPARVRITVAWLDGSNHPTKTPTPRVRVTLDAPYYPLSTFFFRSGVGTSSSSTMPMAH